MSKIYYIIPDLYKKKSLSIRGLVRASKQKKFLQYLSGCIKRTFKPVGGVKIIYQHCVLLRELGYEAYPLLMGKYEGNFFGFDVETVRFEDVKNHINEDDIVVATEFEPYQGLVFKNATKIMFLQNWVGLWSRRNTEDQHKNYLELGYDKVITCSEYCSDYVRKQMGIEVNTITNGIDTSVFTPGAGPKKHRRILAMSRKNPADLERIMTLLSDTEYEFKVVDGLSQSDLISEYQRADIFLATGYPEGFGLPPLEAMCCNCVVVGFTGGAASEFMIDGDTALVADDGDCEKVANDLRQLLNDTQLKDNIRNQGYKKAVQYSIENTKSELKDYYGELIKLS